MTSARMLPNEGGFRKASNLRGMIRRRARSGTAWATLALIKPVAIAVHFQDMDMMREAVEERTREPL